MTQIPTWTRTKASLTSFCFMFRHIYCLLSTFHSIGWQVKSQSVVPDWVTSRAWPAYVSLLDHCHSMQYTFPVYTAKWADCISCCRMRHKCGTDAAAAQVTTKQCLVMGFSPTARGKQVRPGFFNGHNVNVIRHVCHEYQSRINPAM